MDPNNLTPEQQKELEEKLKNMSPEEIADLQRQQCIFCQIVDGKVPSKKVYEDNICLAVLDIRPATKGHLLILPKEHFSIMPQIPETKLDHLFITTKVLSKVLLKSLRCGGTNIFIANGLAAGQRAPHFMIHLIPRKKDDELFNFEENGVDLEVQKEIYQKVIGHFNKFMGIDTQSTIPEHEERKETEETENETGDEEVEEHTESNVEDDDDDEQEGSDEDLEENDESEHTKNEDDVDASLDDIANLFK